jgi:hypothetical protein
MNFQRIRQLFGAILIAALVVQPACGQLAAAPTPVPSPQTPAGKSKLKRGLQIEFVLLDSVSSKDAFKGQTIRFAVAEDVLAGGLVVIPRGTPATGVVSSVRKGVPGKQDGDVELEPRAILLADGSRLKLGGYPPGEDACGDMGPCWALITFAIAVSPILITLGLIRLPERLEEDKKFKQQPGLQKPAIAGNDQTVNPCWHSSAYTVHGFQLPVARDNSVTPDIAANRATLEVCAAAQENAAKTGNSIQENTNPSPTANPPGVKPPPPNQDETLKSVPIPQPQDDPNTGHR